MHLHRTHSSCCFCSIGSHSASPMVSASLAVAPILVLPGCCVARAVSGACSLEVVVVGACLVDAYPLVPASHSWQHRGDTYYAAAAAAFGAHVLDDFPAVGAAVAASASAAAEFYDPGCVAAAGAIHSVAAAASLVDIVDAVAADGGIPDPREPRAVHSVPLAAFRCYPRSTQYPRCYYALLTLRLYCVP